MSGESSCADKATAAGPPARLEPVGYRPRAFADIRFGVGLVSFVHFFFLDRAPDPFLGGPLPRRRRYRSLASLRSSRSVLKPGITCAREEASGNKRKMRENTEDRRVGPLVYLVVGAQSSHIARAPLSSSIPTIQPLCLIALTIRANFSMGSM
jgi:hypothetical protein